MTVIGRMIKRVLYRRCLDKDAAASISDADRLFLNYSDLAQRQGFDRLNILLSFDCDTPDDIKAAEHVSGWLAQRNIQAAFAVPGVLLEQGVDVYRRIAGNGGDFINHGARPHTEWREGRYWSVNSYHTSTRQEIEDDIHAGHEIALRVLGRAPVGFRAPHFGNFQKPEQRVIIYETLRSLGYAYSSSTLPELGFQHGPALDAGGLWEFPLSGTIAAPYSAFDSWSYVVSPYQPVVREEYGDLFIRTLTRLLELEVCGVLNYYVDPAHVRQAGAFYRALEYAQEQEVTFLNFDDMVRMVGK